MPPVEGESQVDPALDPANQGAASGADGSESEGQNQGQDAGDGQQPGGGEGASASADAGQQQQVDQAAAAAAAQPPKDATKPFQERINVLTKHWRTTERERDALAARLEEVEKGQRQPGSDTQNGDQPVSLDPRVIEEMVDKRADAKAEAKVAAAQFDNDCNNAFAEGKKAHGEAFELSLQRLGALGGLEPDVVQDALATDAPHEVLHALGQNAEEAMRILRLPRGRRIAEFTKMTIKVPAKPAVSKAPAPITPIGGSAKKDFDPLDPSVSDEDWHARQDEIERAQRAAR